MIKVAFTKLLQHLIAQNSWAKELLQPYASKSVLLNISVFHQTLIILEDGQLAISGEANIPDATMSLSPSTLLRLLMQDVSANMQVSMTGDTELAKVLAQVLTNMRWDAEDDLSHLIGDIPSNQIVASTKKIASTLQDASINAIEMVTEFLQEEKSLITKKSTVENFNAEVDALRANTARFEKKLDKLIKRANQLNPNSLS